MFVVKSWAPSLADLLGRKRLLQSQGAKNRPGCAVMLNLKGKGNSKAFLEEEDKRSHGCRSDRLRTGM